MPDTFELTDAVLDIGGHIGSFALACSQRDAKLIHSYEPCPANFEHLERNAAKFGATVFPEAITSKSGTVRYVIPADANNMASCQTAPGEGVKATDFDRAAFRKASACVSASNRVRLCKIDCEGAEYDFIPTAKRLDLIDEVCGECHNSEYPELLVVALKAAAFVVEVVKLEKDRGLFFGRRI